MEHAGAPGAERRCACCLDSDEADVVVEEGGEHADRVRPAADARDDGFRKRALRLEQLRARLAPDHGLQLADELRVGSWADARADHVVGRLDVRDPVADRCARRLLERPRARLDRLHGGAEETHPLDVRRLPAHVLGAHVHHALEPEPRAGGRGRDAVLAGPRLGDDPALPEPPGEDDLSERVVDLVRAGVVQVLALEVDPPAGCEPLHQRDR